MSRASRADRDDAGVAAVEFAIVMTLLLVLVFGIIQYGMYFFASQTGSAAAREAVRRAAVGACSDAQLTQFVYDRVNSGAIAGDASDLTVTRTFLRADGTSASSPGEVGGTVRVRVSFPTFNGNFPFVPFLDDPKFERTVDARLENTSNPGAC